jgi:3-phosphoshikimate 1-carboxyvinyltransferase
VEIRLVPGARIEGETQVPGDKSIAHRWLILAATASGRSEIHELPPALDVRSTAACLGRLVPEARPALEAWASRAPRSDEPEGFTFNKGEPRPAPLVLDLDGRGRARLEASGEPLDCGNSGTTMRLLSGVLAACGFETVLTGDGSLRERPMERVAEPLRQMGAVVESTHGHAPLRILGASLHGIRHRAAVPSAQVKGALLLAGLAAEGETTVEEDVPTRDHTERALEHLGAGVRRTQGGVTVSSFQHGSFAGTVPGDVSSAAFLIAAAAVTGGGLTLRRVGLNPTRTRYLGVMARMGVRTEHVVSGGELGEPVGDLQVEPSNGLRGTTVTEDELPLVIDEVPVLAALAACARGETWFAGGSELRVKESDRLGGLARAIVGFGGHAAVEGEDLVVVGGGLGGGVADPLGDHRMAMALTVAALGAEGPSIVRGAEAADVSFPGFFATLGSLGARIEGRGSG